MDAISPEHSVLSCDMNYLRPLMKWGIKPELGQTVEAPNPLPVDIFFRQISFP